MERTAPDPQPESIHTAIGFLQNFLIAFLDHEQAKTAQFTAVMEYTGPGGGSWTFRVADGQCHVTKEHVNNADLVMTQDPVTFELIRQSKLDPQTAMQSGALKIQGVDNMPTFMKLFPAPTLDRKIEPMGAPSLG